MVIERDEGYFGPDSVSWQVHREVTVLFGGARALLMQAAHPLVVAGANQTAMYERNPWKRLQRTLILTYTMTFGTKADADAAARKINDVHTRINGIDPITGKRYDALDPELLLYVHACLVDSALLFEELTVGALDDEGRDRFHREQMLAAELCLVPREIDPADRPRAASLARRLRGPRGAAGHRRRSPRARPLLRTACRGRMAPDPARRVASGLRHAPAGGARDVRPAVRADQERGAMRATFPAIRATRPLLPPKFRFIAPYQDFLLRQRGIEPGDQIARARRQVGIRL